MKLLNPNNCPIIARINNSFSMRKRKHVEPNEKNKRRKKTGWKRHDLSISIPKSNVIFAEEEICDHLWSPCRGRQANEHTTYVCTKCGKDDGFA